MKLVKYQGRLPDCVEGFADDCERSSEDKGAIHFHTGKTVELSDDEYAHIKAQRKDLAANLVVLREWQADSKKKPEVAPAAPEASKKLAKPSGK